MNSEIVQKVENSNIITSNNKSSLGLIVYSVVIFIFIYLLIIRPNKKRVNEYNKIIDNLKLGDEITVNGIYGKIKSINENVIELEVSKNTIIKINKNMAYVSKK